VSHLVFLELQSFLYIIQNYVLTNSKI
jgi:hypothetical protein